MGHRAQKGAAYVPYFPLGGRTPIQSAEVDQGASLIGAKPLEVALCWLLQRAPNTLTIPGTSSVPHSQVIIVTANVRLSPEAMRRTNELSSSPR